MDCATEFADAKIGELTVIRLGGTFQNNNWPVSSPKFRLDQRVGESVHPQNKEINKTMSQSLVKTRHALSTIKTILSTLCLAVFAVDCASGVKFSEYRTTVPPPPEGYGRIWCYRPSTLGAAIQPAVKLDDQAVGNAVPKDFFHLETPPMTPS